MVDAWLMDLGGAGIDPLITCTTRSGVEQAALYAKGRSEPGPIVTKAMPGQSAHQYGLAIDFVIIDAGKADWSGDSPAWNKAIAMAQIRGMHSLRPMESAHLEHPGWKTLAGRTSI